MRSAQLIVLFAVITGCAGKAVTESRPGTAGAASSSGGTASAGEPGISTGGSPINGIPPVDEGGAGPSIDAGPPPLAAGGTAGMPSTIDPGPACINSSACSVAAADVACKSDADCKLLVIPGCSTQASVIGVNVRNAVTCAMPRCATLPSGFLFQDCNSTSDLMSAAVHCIGNRCLTSLGGCQPCDLK